ncbi:hypothetical protein H0H81_012776 [Sphagnurus paluster]|uniref:Uncharacterized protein n=1 Tax=Sphagnurus paluster TaxID=117069 RepID=A0A9P7GGQ6_9AGAR|nr:hypothetical protein H0H81_012776 [Sphagnurus paluster]
MSTAPPRSPTPTLPTTQKTTNKRPPVESPARDNGNFNPYKRHSLGPRPAAPPHPITPTADNPFSLHPDQEYPPSPYMCSANRYALLDPLQEPFPGHALGMPSPTNPHGNRATTGTSASVPGRQEPTCLEDFPLSSPVDESSFIIPDPPSPLPCSISPTPMSTTAEAHTDPTLNATTGAPTGMNTDELGLATPTTDQWAEIVVNNMATNLRGLSCMATPPGGFPEIFFGVAPTFNLSTERIFQWNQKAGPKLWARLWIASFRENQQNEVTAIQELIPLVVDAPEVIVSPPASQRDLRSDYKLPPPSASSYPTSHR